MRRELNSDELFEVLNRGRGGKWIPNKMEWMAMGAVIGIFLGAVAFIIATCLF